MELDPWYAIECSRDAGGHRRRLFAAMETGCSSFSVGAAEHAWLPHLTPSPFLLHGVRKGELGAGEEYWQPSTQWLLGHGTCPMKSF